MHTNLLYADWFLSLRQKWVRMGHVFPAHAAEPLSNDIHLNHQRNSYSYIRSKGSTVCSPPHCHLGVIALSYCIECQCEFMHHGDIREVWSSLGLYLTQKFFQVLVISWYRIKTIGCGVGRDSLFASHWVPCSDLFVSVLMSL